MSLFGSFFSRSGGESVALIEIGANAVAGALVRYEPGKPPLIVYTAREYLAPHPGEPAGATLLRGLTELGEELTKEGPPLLRKVAGSGRIHRTIASIGAPWEASEVKLEQLASDKPFTFTHSLLESALKRNNSKPAGHVLTDQIIVATSLSGYVTREPFGKTANRGRIVILTASMEAEIADVVAKWLRSAFHSHAITLTAFASVAYEGVRALFPHEREYVLLDARGGNLSLMLIRHELLVATTMLKAGENNVSETFRTGLEELAKGNPLPPTIFVLADQLEGAGIRDAIASGHLETLWLGSNPPRIFLVTGSELADHVAVSPPAQHDLYLSLMASVYAQRKGGQPFTKEQ